MWGRSSSRYMILDRSVFRRIRRQPSHGRAVTYSVAPISRARSETSRMAFSSAWTAWQAPGPVS